MPQAHSCDLPELPQIRLRARALAAALARFSPAPERSGRVTAFDGTMFTVTGLNAAIGSLVRVAGAAPDEGASGEAEIAAEVVGFRRSDLLLMALDRGSVAPDAVARLDGRADAVAVGPSLLGRVVDGMGRAVDGKGAIHANRVWPLGGCPLPSLDRAEVREAVPTGIRAIDALLTLGRGQRIGLIAGSGVGKSVLMQQFVQGTQADAIVVALIGERGREIAGFTQALSPQARTRTHIVAVPADHAAPLRVRGAMRAFAVAEALRRDGQHVLLLLDSLTRVAHAQREVGLAVGEPGGQRGYPASALALIARLVERAGNDARTGGAITAILTVLADGDDVVADPVVDAARGVLDGHIVLSRSIAGRGRFPAIDLGASISRTMADCVSPDHLAAAARFRRDAALIEANRDLVTMGAYARGQDAALDRALERETAVEALLGQPRTLCEPYSTSVDALLSGWSA